MQTVRRDEFDVVVVGGGLVGAAVAWGLAGLGQRVAVLDEGDVAVRASRGNFALIWVQSKGLGMPGYSRWTRESADLWASFAATLRDDSGMDVSHRRPGGLTLLLSDAEWERRESFLRTLSSQPGMDGFRYEMLDHAAVERLVPGIGPDVLGASYCPLDGDCNALRLIRALHVAMQRRGVAYLPDHRVDRIAPAAGEFRLSTRSGEIRAGKVVLAAGLGNAALGPMVGLDVAVYPQRGQLLVTEKVAPFLAYPVSKVRQTDEGGVMIGDSMENAGFDDSVGIPLLAVLAHRAQRAFPRLARLNVVRAWSCLRVMTKDGFPIYAQSEAFPGAFAFTCHSGVTLAAIHAFALPPFVANGTAPSGEFGAFSHRRFHVQAAS
jgi:glycine/D-amino acid oxidase-like deaminating enzyme